MFLTFVVPENPYASTWERCPDNSKLIEYETLQKLIFTANVGIFNSTNYNLCLYHHKYFKWGVKRLTPLHFKEKFFGL